MWISSGREKRTDDKKDNDTIQKHISNLTYFMTSALWHTKLNELQILSQLSILFFPQKNTDLKIKRNEIALLGLILSLFLFYKINLH